MTSYERLVDRYVRLSLGRPWTVLALFLIPTAIATWFGMRIETRTRLEDLLPEDAPSVMALQEARARRGSAELFTIAVESPDPLSNVQFVDAIAERLRGWEEAEYVEVAQDRSFFREHALLFLPVEDLRHMKENLQRLIRQRLAQVNPLFIDLEADGSGLGEPEGEFEWRNPDVWVNPITVAELGLTRREVDAVFDFLRGDAGQGSGEAAEPVDPVREAMRRLPRQYRDYRLAPHGRVAVVTARLRGTASDVGYSRTAYQYGERLIRELDPHNFHPEMRAQVVGAYRSFLEVRSIVRDSSKATAISTLLVLGLIVAFFRNGRSLVIVLVPLAASIAWTLGSIDLVYGRLNSLTLFVFSILVGMGIDFGIHVYGRTMEEFTAGGDWQASLFVALTRTGSAMIAAVATTVVSLLTLVFAHFRGFAEFGVACAIGIGLALVAAWMLIPPLVGACEAVWPLRRRERRRRTTDPGGTARKLGVLRGAAVLVLALSAWGAYAAGDVQFEYDFSRLRGPGTGQTIAYGQALGAGRSSAPSVMVGQSEAQMREVHALLREALRAGDRRVRAFMTIETLVPSDQAERMQVIGEIYDVLDRRAVRRLDGDEGRLVRELLELTDVRPFTFEELPEWARATLTERDGSHGALGLLYPRVHEWDAVDVAALQKHWGSIRVPSGEVHVASNAFIIADVIRYVQADGGRLAVFVTLGLLIVLLAVFRDIVAAAICLATLGAGVLLTAAIMAAWDIRIGLYNMIVLPTMLGTGIDAAIHLFHRYREEGRERIWHVVRTTGLAVTASSLTTVAGFAGLLFVSHKGVLTIGSLAVAGIGCAWIAALGLLPGLLSVFGRANTPPGAPSTDASGEAPPV